MIKKKARELCADDIDKHVVSHDRNGLSFEGELRSIYSASEEIYLYVESGTGKQLAQHERAMLFDEELELTDAQ